MRPLLLKMVRNSSNTDISDGREGPLCSFNKANSPFKQWLVIFEVVAGRSIGCGNSN